MTTELVRSTGEAIEPNVLRVTCKNSPRRKNIAKLNGSHCRSSCNQPSASHSRTLIRITVIGTTKPSRSISSLVPSGLNHTISSLSSLLRSLPDYTREQLLYILCAV